MFCDMTGMKYGRLRVISRSTHKDSSRDVFWNCLCDCGKEVIVNGRHLRNGHTSSCGCLQKELFSRRLTKHGYSRRGNQRPRLYRIWCAMKTRCTNPRTKDWKNYGGRGITICPEWAADFSAFHSWAVSHGYDDSLTIDRCDNDYGYYPDNCRWATREEQNRNTRITKEKERKNAHNL